MPKRHPLQQKNLYALQALTWSERLVLLKAFFLLPLMQLGLRLFGFTRWQHLLWHTIIRVNGSLQFNEAHTTHTQNQAKTIARLTMTAARYSPSKPTCLPQSLTTMWILHRRGINSQLCIGAHKKTGQFAAHAWVEYQGVALNESLNIRQQYATFELHNELTGVGP